MVDVRDVMGAKGAAAYLAKYLTKAALSYEVLVDRGFSRRWSSSNNWPGGKRVRLRGTINEIWERSDWVSSRGFVGESTKKWVNQSYQPYLAREGDEISEMMEEKAEKEMYLAKLKEFGRMVQLVT